MKQPPRIAKVKPALKQDPRRKEKFWSVQIGSSDFREILVCSSRYCARVIANRINHALYLLERNRP